MGRAGDRVSSKQGPQGMSYGQGRRQGQQQAGPAGNGQGRRQGQQQAGPTGNELWAGPAAVRHEQGWQQAGPNINVMSCP